MVIIFSVFIGVLQIVFQDVPFLHIELVFAPYFFEMRVQVNLSGLRLDRRCVDACCKIFLLQQISFLC